MVSYKLAPKKPKEPKTKTENTDPNEEKPSKAAKNGARDGAKRPKKAGNQHFPTKTTDCFKNYHLKLCLFEGANKDEEGTSKRNNTAEVISFILLTDLLRGRVN